MKDTRYNPSEDDFEIEISDIPDLDTADSIPIPVTQPLRFTLKSRLTSRQRTIRGMITATAMMVALLLILGSYLPIRDVVALDFAGLIPTPVPPLAPGSNLFYIQRTLNWSTVSLDGQELPDLPVISSDPPLQLARGSHQITWQAEPFEPITCTLTVPAASTDTCLSNDIARAPNGIYVKVISFLPTLNTLSFAPRTALIQTAQESLDALESSTTVEPGEHFFSLKLKSFLGTAAQPLHATLRFQLDTDNRYLQPCYLEYVGKPCAKRLIQDCRLFCSTLTQPSASGEKGWNVFANILSHWEYTTPGGQIIAQDQPQSLTEHLVALHITWDNQWHVSILPLTSVYGGFACTLARDKINLNASYSFAAGDFSKQVTWQFAPAPNLATGCLAVATVAQNVGVSTPTVAICLYRFGLLLAVNSTAHLYWPLMPQADTFEQSLALHIASLSTSQLRLPPVQELSV
jgi:hypothetical protein